MHSVPLEDFIIATIVMEYVHIKPMSWKKVIFDIEQKLNFRDYLRTHLDAAKGICRAQDQVN